jgi:aspartate/methionine/tyrosine aminotransferase
MPDDLTFIPPLPAARERVLRLAGSKIRQVADAAMGREGVLPFWFGESDLPTPAPIREAGARALAEGRTFYTQNLGTPALREAIAAYLTRLHGQAFEADRVAVTSSAVTGLMLVMQAILDPGDRVVCVTPVWPNLFEIPKVLGAEVATVPLGVENGVWRLDLDRLLDALTPDTRLLLVNTPNNPSGWVIRPEEQAAILEHCRSHGVWVIADEVYERLAFDRPDGRAASFLTQAEPGDRLVGVNSFSKAWSMTGWRLGWLVPPAELMADLAKLIEYNTSCPPDFVQSAGVTALEVGEPFVEEARLRLLANRDRLLAALGGIEGVQAPRPEGAMYQFFRVEGVDDTVAFARRLVAEAGLGLAPGAAFGDDFQDGWLRWCLATGPERLEQGVARLQAFMQKNSGR